MPIQVARVYASTGNITWLPIICTNASYAKNSNVMKGQQFIGPIFCFSHLIP